MIVAAKKKCFHVTFVSLTRARLVIAKCYPHGHVIGLESARKFFHISFFFFLSISYLLFTGFVKVTIQNPLMFLENHGWIGEWIGFPFEITLTSFLKWDRTRAATSPRFCASNCKCVRTQLPYIWQSSSHLLQEAWVLTWRQQMSSFYTTLILTRITTNRLKTAVIGSVKQGTIKYFCSGIHNFTFAESHIACRWSF